MITDLIEQARNNPPIFHLDSLCRYQEWINGKYFLDGSETINAVDVDISRVIGHDQIYAAMTWAQMLHGLKRMKLMLKELAQDSDYYLRHQLEPDWSFIEVGDKLFISSGKHRTVILRYLAHYNPEHFSEGPIARGVQLYKRKLDHETTELVEAISRKIEPYEYLRFRYAGALMGERRWQLINQCQGLTWNLTRSQLEELNQDLAVTNHIKRILGRGYHARFRRSIWTGFGPDLD